MQVTGQAGEYTSRIFDFSAISAQNHTPAASRVNFKWPWPGLPEFPI